MSDPSQKKPQRTLEVRDLALSYDGHTVVEGGPALNVAVTRSAPFTGAGAVTWTTANGSAVAGTDFGTSGLAVARTGTVVWTAGTGGTKNITVGTAVSNIPVINDTAIEATKSFEIADQSAPLNERRMAHGAPSASSQFPKSR